jgi:hypothetical protein
MDLTSLKFASMKVQVQVGQEVKVGEVEEAIDWN